MNLTSQSEQKPFIACWKNPTCKLILLMAAISIRNAPPTSLMSEKLRLQFHRGQWLM